MSIEQTTECDLAYVADTRELIKDVLASNSIPEYIALTAITSFALELLKKHSKTPSEFARKVIDFCNGLEQASLVIILTQSQKRETND